MVNLKEKNDEISKIVGLRKKTIYTRIKRGWDLDEAILTPVQKCGYKKKKTINL